MISRRYTTYEPLSLIPANGWQWVYASGDDSDPEKGPVFAHAGPLVAFASTKETDIQVRENGVRAVAAERVSIMGYYAGGDAILPAEVAGNFIGYLAPGEPIPELDGASGQGASGERGQEGLRQALGRWP